MRATESRFHNILQTIAAHLELYKATDTHALKSTSVSDAKHGELSSEFSRIARVRRAFDKVTASENASEEDIAQACVAGVDSLFERANHYRRMAKFSSQIAYIHLAVEIERNATTYRRHTETLIATMEAPAQYVPAA